MHSSQAVSTPKLAEARFQSGQAAPTTVREVNPPSFLMADVNCDLHETLQSGQRSPIQSVLQAAALAKQLNSPANCKEEGEDIVGSPKQRRGPSGKARSPHVVTRQCTPLLYRVKDVEDGDENKVSESPGSNRRAGRKCSPMGLSRSLDRERHGGLEEAPAPAASAASTPQPTPQREAHRICRATPGKSRSPSPRCQLAMPGSWSVERVPASTEPVTVAVPQEIRAMTPTVPPHIRHVKACKQRRTPVSRSPTPNGTPLSLSREADRERHGRAPVTIWRGLDQEKTPAMTASLPEHQPMPDHSCITASPGDNSMADEWSHGQMSPQPPRLEFERSVASPPVPSPPVPSPNESVQHRNVAEALLYAAGRVRDPPRPAPETPSASLRPSSACSSTHLPYGLSSSFTRRSLTPLGRTLTATAPPLSARSTLPARLPARQAPKPAPAAPAPQAAAPPTLLQGTTLIRSTKGAGRVFSPGASPRANVGVRSSAPGLSYVPSQHVMLSASHSSVLLPAKLQGSQRLWPGEGAGMS